MCDWARRAVEEFNSRAQSLLESDPYVIIKELNPDNGRVELKLRLKAPFPKELRGLASDGLKNIRDALDQATAAASFVVSGKRSRRTHFPFAENADDLENSLSLKRVRHCRDIPEELFPFIRKIKPYPHEDDTALKTLNLVVGDHKHGVSLSLGASANEIQLHKFAINGGGGFTMPPVWRPEKGELIIAWHLPGAKADFDLYVPVYIGFSSPHLWLTPAGQFLDYIVARVSAIVSGFRGEAERIVAARA